MGRRSGVLAASVTALLAAACSGTSPNADACLPGDFVRVPLGDGGVGYEECAFDGGGYRPFAGDPNLLPDAAPEAPEASAVSSCDTTGGAKLGFMCAACAVNDDCATGLTCFPFNNKGPHCTHSCISAADCPAPSGGCGNTGFCKPR